MQSQNFTSSFTVEQEPAESSTRSTMSGDGGQERSRAMPKRWATSSHTTTRAPTTPSRRSLNSCPAKKVVWHVVDSHLEGPEDPSEWTGTEISFEIAPREDGTEVRFSHLGLIPDFECYDGCSSAWGFFVNGSLKHLITTGEGPATPPWA